MNRTAVLFSLMLALTLALGGCSAAVSPDRPSEGASISGATMTHDQAGDWEPFTIRVEKPGDPIGVDFRGNVAAGSVKVQLLDPQGREVWGITVGVGPFGFNQTVDAAQAGEYKLRLAWEGAILMQYSLMWRPFVIAPPVITPVALLGPVGMLLVAIGFMVYGLRGGGGWRYLLLGALFWIVTVALKFAWALSFNTAVYDGLRTILPDPVALPIFEVYVGALTGISEVGITYLVLRLTHWARVGWAKALAFGVGFGAVEAILLAISPLVGVITGLTDPNQLPGTALQSLAALNNPLLGLSSPWERFFTIWIHIFCSVLLFYSIRTGQGRPFWFAFAYKTALDTIAAMAQGSGFIRADALGAIWVVELVVGVLGGMAWWGTRRIKERFPASGASAATANQAETQS